MNKQPLIDFIQKNVPNIPVTPQSVLAIAEVFEERAFAKNEYLLTEGKISGYFYLAEGCMRAFTFDIEGEEVTTYFYTSGRVVFEAASFFLHVPSAEIIQALSNCTGYYTTFDKVNTLFHTVPEFREFGRLMIVKEFVAYKQRALAMINKSAEERYGELITTNAEILQHAQLRHIASYLGMTDSTLSRIRRDYSKK
jgi:CRP-like cAMP-binding protein